MNDIETNINLEDLLSLEVPKLELEKEEALMNASEEEQERVEEEYSEKIEKATILDEEKIEKYNEEQYELLENEIQDSIKDLERQEQEDKERHQAQDKIMNAKIQEKQAKMTAEVLIYKAFSESEEAKEVIKMVASLYEWMGNDEILSALMKDHPEFTQKLIKWYKDMDLVEEITSYIGSLKK